MILNHQLVLDTVDNQGMGILRAQSWPKFPPLVCCFLIHRTTVVHIGIGLCVSRVFYYHMTRLLERDALLITIRNGQMPSVMMYATQRNAILDFVSHNPLHRPLVSVFTHHPSLPLPSSITFFFSRLWAWINAGWHAGSKAAYQDVSAGRLTRSSVELVEEAASTSFRSPDGHLLKFELARLAIRLHFSTLHYLLVAH